MSTNWRRFISDCYYVLQLQMVREHVLEQMLSLQYLTTSLRMRRTSSFFDMEPSFAVQSVQSRDASALEGGGLVCGGPQSGQSPPQGAGFHRASRWLCFLTTCLAFILGVGVGIAVPMLYASSAIEINGNNSRMAAGPWAVVQDPSSVVHLPLDLASGGSSNASASNIPTRMSARMKAYLRKKEKEMQLTNNNNNNNQQRSSSSTPTVDSDDNVVSFVQTSGIATAIDQQDKSQEQQEASAGQAVIGIYWSPAVEDILPTGFDEVNAKEWNDFSHQTPIVRVEEGCGRMQNRLITFESGRQSCCRYRQNYDQIQGEIFSFYLSRLLGLRNLPPSSLGLVRPQDRQWINVQSSLSQAQWTEDRPVVYTQFLNDLEPAYIPVQFRGRDRHLNPSDVQHHNLQETGGRDELLTLAQWSDLLVLDYLTANLDRMVNNLYNMQWNPAMMDSPAHNLARDSKTGLLVFLDNESGLLHGYRLLDKYEMYHKSLLDSLCVFRRTTVDALRQLQSQKNVGKLLRHMFETRDQSLLDFLPFLPEKSIKTLNYRIDQVLEQVTKCQSLYGAA